MTRPHTALVPLLLLVLAASAVPLVGSLAGCGKRGSAVAKGHVEGAAIAAAVGSASGAPNAPTKQHGARKLQNVDVPVWLDGKQMAVLRYGELPSTVKPRAPADEPEAAPRLYRLDEYLKAVGVPVERVRAIHLLGNRDKVASIEGTELRAQKERFVFDFMQETSGIAKTRWDTTGLKNLYRIDEIRALSVYVDKVVPVIDPSLHCHLLPGASANAPVASEQLCASDDPYSNNERAKGTRVYIDGRLAGYVKRRLLPDSVVAGKDEAGEYRFSLTKFMSTLGVDASSAQAIELVSEDDVIARAGAADWKKSDLSFTLAKHEHGRVHVRIPAAMQAKSDEAPAAHEAMISAVLVHHLSPPSTHVLSPIDDELPDSNQVATRDNGE